MTISSHLQAGGHHPPPTTHHPPPTTHREGAELYESVHNEDDGGDVCRVHAVRSGPLPPRAGVLHQVVTVELLQRWLLQLHVLEREGGREGWRERGSVLETLLTFSMG